MKWKITWRGVKKSFFNWVQGILIHLFWILLNLNNFSNGTKIEESTVSKIFNNSDYSPLNFLGIFWIQYLNTLLVLNLQELWVMKSSKTTMSCLSLNRVHCRDIQKNLTWTKIDGNTSREDNESRQRSMFRWHENKLNSIRWEIRRTKYRIWARDVEYSWLNYKLSRLIKFIPSLGEVHSLVSCYRSVLCMDICIWETWDSSIFHAKSLIYRIAFISFCIVELKIYNCNSGTRKRENWRWY